jgi:serine/threonine protein kinase
VSVWRSKGWVHADVKPDNIGVDSATGMWYFLDVESVCRHGGIGKRVNALVTPIHTAKYAAPELLLPHPFVTDTTDLYSVGVILRDCCDVSIVVAFLVGRVFVCSLLCVLVGVATQGDGGMSCSHPELDKCGTGWSCCRNLDTATVAAIA